MSTRPLTGRHVLIIFLGFFALVIGVNVLMATLAIRTFSGVEEDSAYTKGLAYNAKLAERDQMARYGYEVTLDAARTATGAATLTAHYVQNGQPAHGLSVEATIRHPANAHLDRAVTLTDAGDGRYSAELSGLDAANWTVILTAHDGSRLVSEARKDGLWLH